MTLKATLRKDDFGSAGSRRLIKAGFLPAEMYGKKGNVHIVLNAHDFDIALRKLPIGKECEIDVEGKVYKCIFLELQEDPMRGLLKHADFKIV